MSNERHIVPTPGCRCDECVEYVRAWVNEIGLEIDRKWPPKARKTETVRRA